MAYWDGTRWIAEEQGGVRRPRTSSARRLLGAGTEATLITLLMFGLIAGTALAGKGDNGGKPHRTVNECAVDGNVVSASDLPTDEVINFMITDGSGTWGWVLGFAGEGATWDVTVPDRSGPTTYEFVSRTWGPNGSKYTVFSSCSADG